MAILTYQQFEQFAELLRTGLFLADYPVIDDCNEHSLNYASENNCVWDTENPHNSCAWIRITFLSQRHAIVFDEVFRTHGLLMLDRTAIAMTNGRNRVLNWAASNDCLRRENIQQACQALSRQCRQLDSSPVTSVTERNPRSNSRPFYPRAIILAPAASPMPVATSSANRLTERLLHSMPRISKTIFCTVNKTPFAMKP